VVPIVDGPEALLLAADIAHAEGGEFCVSLRLDPLMVAATCRHGCMPMGLEIRGRQILLIKCHERRSVLDFADLHTSKSTVRRARGLSLEIDRDFRSCLAAVVASYPDRWLVEGLCESLASLHEAPLPGVRFHSVEVYEGAELAAGEIGYGCGAVYTSLAGFHRRSGAGSVQLASLGAILESGGFAFWDLGMDIEYKRWLGSRPLPWAQFLERFLGERDREAQLARGPWDCEALLRGRRRR
jgi:Leu/Phe-tRNA-protein transferase